MQTFTIPDGLYAGSKTATANDTNLVAGNIVTGVSILGVAGTQPPSQPLISTMKIPFSRRRKLWRTVDVVAVTHPDADHVSGLRRLADKMTRFDGVVIQAPHHGSHRSADVVAARPAIIQPPNRWMRGVAEFAFSKETFRGVFEPLLADQAHEWSEAIAEGRVWKVRWILIKYAGHFAVHFVAQGPLSVVKLIVEMWKLT